MLRTIEYFLIRFEKLIKDKAPSKVLSIGYLTYMIVGFGLLCLPFSQADSVEIIDNLFISVSAVSTTGLVTVDPGTSYTLFGEFVILLLVQLGGIGYMTFGSFIILQTGHRISLVREKMTRTAFPLPESLNVKSFLKGVIFFTIVAETIGAILLSYFFYLEGYDSPVWSGIFHSISAFCTAGFSLYPNSFESLSDNLAINLILSSLSLLGSMGFIVVVDLWLRIVGKRKEVLFTSKVILAITTIFMVLGTFVLYFFEPTINTLPHSQRLLTAFFQTMTSSTTVGFNSLPIGDLSPHIIMLLFFFMIFGASPSGTGGGLKSTTFSALFGLVKSTLTKREAICFWNRKIPMRRLQYAGSSFIFCAFVLGLSAFFLCYTETADFQIIIFEAISALGTVGLSMGLTGDLSTPGKLIIILLMMIGRIGVLTFGLAVSTADTSALVDGDNDLVV